MTGIDYGALAEGVDAMREAMRAMVNGLVADGFTDKQAREIVTALMVRRGDEEDE